MSKREILAGATDQTIDIFIRDSSSTVGAGLTGLVYNTSSLTCYYRKGATGTPTALTLATQTVGGAHSDGGFVAVDGTNCPGQYRLDLSDTIVASAGMVTLYLRGATNMVPCVVEIEVISVNKFDTYWGMGARMPSTTGTTNLNTIFDTDYASVYNTTGKCLVVQLDNSVAHGGDEATLQLGSTSTVPLRIANSGGDAVQFTASGGNGDAIQLAANGSGSAINATGGATGHGALLTGGATSGNGFKAVGTAGNSAAANFVGQGSAAGLLSTGGATGSGVEFVGGATSGSGVLSRAPTSGLGINASGAGTGNGIGATGGASGHGIYAQGGATNGNGIVGLGQGTGAGAYVLCSDTGVGLQIAGGGTSGDGVSISTTSGHGVNIVPVGTAKHGVKIAGGNGATADGINVAAGTGGVAIRSASNTVTGATTYTGNVSMAAGLTIAQSTLNLPAILVTGNGTAAGIDVTGGATGDGVTIAAGGGSGRALHVGSFTVDGTTVLTGAVSMGSTFAVTGAFTAANASNNIVGIDIAKISGDATAADNAESFFDGTGYAGTNNIIPTVTTVTNQLTDNTIADAVLSRGVSNVEDTANTTSLAAIILAILESSVSGTTWTIRKTGGTTFVAKTITTDAAADPITGVT